MPHSQQDLFFANSAFSHEFDRISQGEHDLNGTGTDPV